MKKVVKSTTEKYVTEKTFKNKFESFENTFESSMRSVAKSFARIEDSIARNSEVSVLILKEIKNIQEQNKNFKQDISSLNSDGLSYDRKIENLTMRVEKLELKNK